VSDASAGDFEDAQPNFADKNLPHRRCCCPPILFLWSLNLARTLRPPLSVGMSASGPSRHFAARHRFWREADTNWQARSAGSVAN